MLYQVKYFLKMANLVLNRYCLTLRRDLEAKSERYGKEHILVFRFIECFKVFIQRILCRYLSVFLIVIDHLTD